VNFSYGNNGSPGWPRRLAKGSCISTWLIPIRWPSMPFHTRMKSALTLSASADLRGEGNRGTFFSETNSRNGFASSRAESGGIFQLLDAQGGFVESGGQGIGGQLVSTPRNFRCDH